ncbi:S-formylglutathione hydrolase YeiG [Sinobacterium norvegicum]|uniref:S-formylglutathione hydrolase n=1 Tax=Sinobacterium norvegicum TaxID=1641715 RepID=A0ABM9ABP2_9GAMM|nr:S-formylglutathione hydrolase [Sinobacterium norvegicum]CAH0990625.1 S-formylglutathione hydrolase YeiG [Sinobacterium norvegicum]
MVAASSGPFLQMQSESLLFGGWQRRYQHNSLVCDCAMTFSIYLPPQAKLKKVPVLYWLSGSGCSDLEFSQQAGAQRVASELGIALVACDTSPRGSGVDDCGSQKIGQGVGMFINATQAPWSRHFNMYDYITAELPQLINMHFAVNPAKASIAGHSDGGHGAIVVALRNPGRFKSVSAFSPLLSASNSRWGQNVFTAYLGANQQAWKSYDATALLEICSMKIPMLIDQGASDQFLIDELDPSEFLAACERSSVDVQYRSQFGYDHSYNFVATFIEQHLRFHAAALA